MIDALRHSGELADIAAELQRSVGAVEGKLKYLVPGDAVRGARAREKLVAREARRRTRLRLACRRAAELRRRGTTVLDRDR
ncbi:hypothetical protein ACWDKQ_23470 [Saccharopolyspora sp. NPDC000995]